MPIVSLKHCPKAIETPATPSPVIAFLSSTFAVSLPLYPRSSQYTDAPWHT